MMYAEAETIVNVSENIVDRANQVFWDELCGTSLARQMGINDFSQQSLMKYDKWYFGLYPYLKKYINQLPLSGNSVLEIGLGYGTLSSYLAQEAGDYFAADIAQGPVDVVNIRLAYLNKKEQASVQSCHNLNFPNESFDNVVSIGCFHHTGSVKKCIDEAYRVLKPGGHLLFMCYNKQSMRMLKTSPFSVFFNSASPVELQPDDAYLYDYNSDSEPAPFTELGSAAYYRKICSNFSSVKISCENWDGAFRKYLLNNMARVLGLDLYIICKK